MLDFIYVYATIVTLLLFVVTYLLCRAMEVLKVYKSGVNSVTNRYLKNANSS